MATVGYGDYTPKGNLGHTLAVAEALMGQLYLVTVVAVLVARMGQRRERHDARNGYPRLIPPVPLRPLWMTSAACGLRTLV